MANSTQEEQLSSSPRWIVVIEGIIAVVLGILLVIKPIGTTTVVLQLLGWFFFIAGLFTALSIIINREHWGWKLFVGVLGVIAGLFVSDHPLWTSLAITTTFAVILGLIGIFIGVSKIGMAFRGAGWGQGILGILIAILGVMVLFNAFISGIALPILLGIFSIIGGLAAIVFTFRQR